MGYTTYFEGIMDVRPPLNEAEQDFLLRFSMSRRMRTSAGPYCVEHEANFAELGIQILDYNEPPEGQPGLWCQWVSLSADEIGWDAGEKFYYSAEWMKYLIDHFLRPGGKAQGEAGFEEFTFDHVVHGTIEAQGQESEDQWLLVVEDNVVMVSTALPVEYGTLQVVY